MPPFVKTKEDEKLWKKAKAVVDENKYPDKVYWKVVTHVFQNMKKGKSKKESISNQDRTPPMSVRKAAQKVLEWKKKYGSLVKGGTQVGWTRANQLAKGEPLSEDTIKRMYQFFQRHEGNQKIDDPKFKNKPWRDKGRVAWNLWGSDAGKSWSTMMWKRIQREKSKKKESIIDHRKPKLNPNIWTEDNKLRQDVKKEILEPIYEVFKENNVPFHDIFSINLVGSMASHRYRPDSDVDIHIMLKPSEDWLIDELVEEIKNIPIKYILNTKHPIEYYIEPYDSLKEYPFNYDIINDDWISNKEELYVDLDYYRALIREKIRNFNDLIFELDSDLIDFEDIKYFAEEKDPQTRVKLKNKINEIELDMVKIKKAFDQVREDRKQDYSDDSIGNITFKFLQKYNLLKRMRKISKLLDDGFQTSDIKSAKERFLNLRKKIKISYKERNFKYTTYGIIDGKKVQQSTNDKQLAIDRLGNYIKGYVTLNLSDRKLIITKKESHNSDYYTGIVVLNNDNQVLLGKRKEDDIWTSPGGGSEEKENPLETALRELKEETNINLNEEDLIKLNINKAKNGKNVYVYYTILNKKQQIKTDNDPDDEVYEWKWFDFNDLPKELENDSERFHSVLKAITEVL